MLPATDGARLYNSASECKRAIYIAAILGHADVNTSQVYTVATNAGLRRAMEALTHAPGQADAIVPTQEERPPMAAAVNR